MNSARPRRAVQVEDLPNPDPEINANLRHPDAFTRADWFLELNRLVVLASDERNAHMAEIISQDINFHVDFSNLLNLDPSAHPYTIKLIEAAGAVGALAAAVLKARYMRPRPAQMYPGMVVPCLQTPKHPSFVSGHALESHMIARSLAMLLPGSEEALLNLARRIARNRERAGWHFRADSIAGEAFAIRLMEFLGGCDTFQEILAAAADEPV